MRKWLLVGLVLTTVVGTVAALAISPPPQEKPKRATQTTSTAPANDEQQRLRDLFDARAPSSWSETRQIAKITARQVRKRYAELLSLSMETTIQTIPKTVVIKDALVMRPKAFTSKVSVDGVPLYEFALKDGKITEHRFPFRGSPNQNIVYDVGTTPGGDNKNSGLGDCVFMDDVPSNWLCLIGGHGQTWVGPGIKMGWMQLVTDDLEENSWFIGREVVDGFPCLVFFYKFETMDRGEIYYIDEKEMLLRKWIGFRVGPKTVASTSMDFRILSFVEKRGKATERK